MNVSFASCVNRNLHPYITAFWQTEGCPHYAVETILPKGVIELIFSFDDAVAYNTSINNRSQLTPRCFVNGMNTRPVHLKLPVQQTFFGIELHPAAAKLLLDVPGGTFLDKITDLELVSKSFGSLWHRLAAAANFHKRVAIAEQWMAGTIKPVDERAISIAGFLKNSMETESVSGLATAFCYSTRQLHRKMQEFFGMPTEGVIRYKRYLHALQQMHRTEATLTQIAHHTNYYDQAHFIREFREFTSLTPGEYRQQQSRLAGHLYQ
jgi:AraC-like DNA-binding protein